jgi:NAD(P)-dependent dehydrogenase (short-subunit alcohol dehydrogenase family)
MKDKTVLVTGANSGIGKATATALARAGARVVMVARDRGRGEAALADVKRESGSDAVELVVGDLSLVRGARALAAEVKARFPRLDVLVNNAGISPDTFEKTAEGFEKTWATNHLGPFVFTLELLPLLEKSAPARIVNVSSSVQKGAKMSWEDPQFERTPYSMMKVYSQSKLLNVMFTSALARRVEAKRITVNALHPGVVKTNLASDLKSPVMRAMFAVFKLFFVSPEKGAETSVYLASSGEVEGQTGKYFEKKREVVANPLMLDEAACDRLWKMTEAHAATIS